MTYDNEIILIGQNYTVDEIGNQIPIETQTKVLCGVKSITRTEFYNAAANGLKPGIVFVVHGYEYNDEKEILYEGKLFKVIRTYSKNFEEIELTCEKVITNA